MGPESAKLEMVFGQFALSLSSQAHRVWARGKTSKRTPSLGVYIAQPASRF
jgi:hypothetical protein